MDQERLDFLRSIGAEVPESAPAKPQQPQQPVQTVQAPVKTPVGSPLENYLTGVTSSLTGSESTMDMLGRMNPVMAAANQFGLAPTPEMIQEYAGPAGEIAGNIAGVAATAGKAPWLRVLGSVAGTVIGRGAGEGAEMLAGEDNVDIVDRLQNIAESGAWALGGEGAALAIQGGVRLIQKVRAGNALTAAEGQELLALNDMLKNSRVKIVNGNVKVFGPNEAIPANAKDVVMTPAQVTQSSTHRLLEKVGKAGFGGEVVDTMYAAQAEAMRQTFQQEIKLLGDRNPLAFGKALQGAYVQVQDELLTFTAPKYKELDAIANTTSFNFNGLRTELRGMLGQGAKDFIPNKGKAINYKTVNSLITNLPDVQAAQLKTLLKRTSNVSFDSGFSDIQILTKMARELRMNPDKVQYAKGIDDIIDVYRGALSRQAKKVAEAGGAQGRNLYNELQNLDDVYEKVIKTTKGDFAKEIMKTNPESIAKALYAEGNVTPIIDDLFGDVRNLRKFSKELEGAGIDSKKIISDFKAGYVDSLFTDLTTSTADDTAKGALDMLSKLGNKEAWGDINTMNTFKSVLNPAERKRLTSLLGNASKLEQISAGNFSLAVRGQQSAGLRKVGKGIEGSLGTAGIAGGVAIASMPATVAAGFAFFMLPRYLARAAVNGKVTDDILREVNGLANKYVSGKFDNATDGAALLALVGSSASRTSDLPPALQGDPELPPEHQVFLKSIEMEAPQFGFPVVDK